MGWVDYTRKQESNAADDTRLEEMDRALRAYLGNGTPPLIKKPGEPDYNVEVNFAADIVNKAASFLFGQGVTFEVGEDSDQAARDWFNLVWPESRRKIQCFHLGVNGAIFGDAWLKIAITEQRQPKVVILDPLNMKVETDEDDCESVRTYVHQYNTEDAAGRPLVRREEYVREGRTWVIQYKEGGENRDWVSFRPDQPWPYPFPPVFHCQNLPNPNQFYGHSDIPKKTIDLSLAIQRLDGLINKIVCNHASPKTIARGLKPQNLQLGIDQILFVPNVEQSIEFLEMTTDLAGAMAYRKDLVQGLAQVSQTPEITSGKVENVGQLSGVAMQILYGPLIAKTTPKRWLYGGLLVEVAEALLTLGKFRNIRVFLKWPELLPNNPLETGQTLTIHKSLGVVSSKTIAEKLNYNWEFERDQMALEEEAARDSIIQEDNGVTGF